ncbi:hypothetical protein RND71_016344 [Anisodus tanguticus]|uniref:Uncharacterized protein n=1 Tax=Anisodus tanguticus TaxID=243964 RepID=A0AAE1S9N7_9SOLA|nr:hypothetical protein RND71_016344 [Anisodus tanguticus]
MAVLLPNILNYGAAPDVVHYSKTRRTNRVTKATIRPPPVIKRVEIVHGKPTIQWTSKEFDEFSVQEGLQFALVAKFAYGRHEVKAIQFLGSCA